MDIEGRFLMGKYLIQEFLHIRSRRSATFLMYGSYVILAMICCLVVVPVGLDIDSIC